MAGELFVQVKASGIENNLRTANHEALAVLNREASAARKDAESAKAEAESERLERMRLEAIVAPRSLSLDQQRMIKDALAGFSGHPVVRVLSYGIDGEAAAVGAQIIAVLNCAHIPVSDQRASFISTGGFEWGIQIRGPNSERKFMSALGTALTSIGRLKSV